MAQGNGGFCLGEVIDEMILKTFRGFYKLQKTNLQIFSPLLSHLFYFTYSLSHFNLPFFSQSSFFDSSFFFFIINFSQFFLLFIKKKKEFYRTIILFYKNLLQIKPEEERGNAKEIAERIKNEISNQLFTSDRIVEFLSILISNFLKLSNKNLQKWDENPEEFYDDFDNDDQLYNLRSAAESTFLIFNSQYSDLTASVVIQYFNSTMQCIFFLFYSNYEVLNIIY